jgi:CRP-like cAMP-binding protein
MIGVNLSRTMADRHFRSTDSDHTPGQSDNGVHLQDMYSQTAKESLACPDCPATRLSVFAPLVLEDGCRFKCLAVPARNTMPGFWASDYRMALVRRGVFIRQRVDREGRTTSVDAAGPGCMFPLGGATETTTSMATGYAATDVLVCLCPPDALGRSLDRREVSDDLIHLQEAALERVERFAEARGRSSAEARIAAVLITLADTLSPPRTRDRIPADLQQRDIARLAGLRHETVCRLLGDLERRGAVRRCREGLRLEDRPALEAV